MSLTRSICSFLISSKDKLDAMMSIIYQEEPRKAKKKKLFKTWKKMRKSVLLYFIYLFFTLFFGNIKYNKTPAFIYLFGSPFIDKLVYGHL